MSEIEKVDGGSRGASAAELARRFGVTARTIERFRARGREVGTAPPFEDAGRLVEWFYANHARPLPAWLERLRGAAEASAPRVERPAELRPATGAAPDSGISSGVASEEGLSDLAVARSIVSARRGDLAACERLPAGSEGRDARVRNAQEAFFKAQEQLRRIEDVEEKARSQAEALMEMTKPGLAALMRTYCDRLRMATFEMVPEEMQAQLDETMRQVLAEFHDELKPQTVKVL